MKVEVSRKAEGNGRTTSIRSGDRVRDYVVALVLSLGGGSYRDYGARRGTERLN
jgi:hypothetical protein